MKQTTINMRSTTFLMLYQTDGLVKLKEETRTIIPTLVRVSDHQPTGFQC